MWQIKTASGTWIRIGSSSEMSPARFVSGEGQSMVLSQAYGELQCMIRCGTINFTHTRILLPHAASHAHINSQTGIYTHTIQIWHIYLDLPWKTTNNVVGKYTSPMDGMGYESIIIYQLSRPSRSFSTVASARLHARPVPWDRCQRIDEFHQAQPRWPLKDSKQSGSQQLNSQIMSNP